jgi:hypothetical protein
MRTCTYTHTHTHSFSHICSPSVATKRSTCRTPTTKHALLISSAHLYNAVTFHELTYNFTKRLDQLYTYKWLPFAEELDTTVSGNFPLIRVFHFVHWFNFCSDQQTTHVPPPHRLNLNLWWWAYCYCQGHCCNDGADRTEVMGLREVRRPAEQK